MRTQARDSNETGQRHCLLAEPSAHDSQPPKSWAVIEIPSSPTQLVRIEHEQSLKTVPAAAGAHCIVETIEKPNHQTRLFVISDPELHLRVNERPAAPAAILKEKDRLQWDDTTFHVSIKHRPKIGAPPKEKIDTECPLCRTPLTTTSRTYSCPCGATFHHDLDEENGLQCVNTLTACQVCNRPIQLQEGFSFLPEDFHE